MSEKRTRIVFDLDETLILCSSTTSVPSDKIGKVEMFTLGDGVVIFLRPGFYDFMRYIRDNFDELYVFTAASSVYAKEVVSVIFNGFNLSSVWTGEDCLMIDSNVYKCLTNKFSPSGEPLDSVRTIMLDDRLDVSTKNVYVRSEPSAGKTIPNHIVIPRYGGDDKDTALFEVIGKLRTWKNSLGF